MGSVVITYIQFEWNLEFKDFSLEKEETNEIIAQNLPMQIS